MDAPELFDRVRQQFTARVDLLRFRDGHDLAGDIAIEKDASLGKFFFRPAAMPQLCARLVQVFPSERDSIVVQAERICRHEFDLLGYEGLHYGDEIDWHCDVVHEKRGPRKPWFKVKYLDFEEVGDSKITWELNRHQHFVVLAKAYCLTGNDRFAREIFAQWTLWKRENPYPIGVNWASSLEVGFRSLSWIWTFFLLQECPLFTVELRQEWLGALRVNGRHIETYLSTYFSPNTHLLGEGTALFFLGVLFPGLPQAKRWRDQGWGILLKGAETQVGDDGFYFEKSTYYHVYALDMFLHARILAGLNGMSIPAEYDRTLQRMLDALLVLGRAGVPPRIGDDDGGRLFDPRRNRQEHLLDPLATGAVVYGNGEYKGVATVPREETLWLLGTKGLDEFESLPAVAPSTDSAALMCSGFYIMADRGCAQQMVIDAARCGSGNGGHAHADSLSIALIRNGRNLLVDPGTFEYVGVSGERGRLRGTGAHNTVQVDRQDQADGAGPFSWNNCVPAKLEQWITGQCFDFFEGSHSGYSRLPSPVTLRRWVFHLKESFWLVLDRAEGVGQHQLDIAWHMGAALSPVSSKRNMFGGGEDCLDLRTVEGHGWGESIGREDWSPAYGRREPTNVVHFSARLELPVDFATLLVAGPSAQMDIGRIVRTDTGTGSVSGFRYVEHPQEHNFIFANRPGSWASGSWTSDAGFIYWSFDREKNRRRLIVCNASYAEAAGHPVFHCENRIKYVEVSGSPTNVEVFSSDPEHVRLRGPLDRIWTDGNLTTNGSGLEQRDL
jgi:hypothetical protein